MDNKFAIERSKTGLPCMWERGGASANKGRSIIICNSRGEKKKAIYIKGRGRRSNGDHALIPLNRWDYIIDASHFRGDWWVFVYQIVLSIKKKDTHVSCDLISDFSCGEWSNKHLEAARLKKVKSVVDIAKKKAGDYHCRVPYYILNNPDDKRSV